ncbi:hypothetical protein HN587_01590, partial [Candidatus Woesearchaeota archaeon]|nr:hypothetical protein [Candidatus Woesearchaeota archaeon]
KRKDAGELIGVHRYPNPETGQWYGFPIEEINEALSRGEKLSEQIVTYEPIEEIVNTFKSKGNVWTLLHLILLDDIKSRLLERSPDEAPIRLDLMIETLKQYVVNYAKFDKIITTYPNRLLEEDKLYFEQMFESARGKLATLTTIDSFKLMNEWAEQREFMLIYFPGYYYHVEEYAQNYLNTIIANKPLEEIKVLPSVKKFDQKSFTSFYVLNALAAELGLPEVIDDNIQSVRTILNELIEGKPLSEGTPVTKDLLKLIFDDFLMGAEKYANEDEVLAAPPLEILEIQSSRMRLASTIRQAEYCLNADLKTLALSVPLTHLTELYFRQLMYLASDTQLFTNPDKHVSTQTLRRYPVQKAQEIFDSLSGGRTPELIQRAKIKRQLMPVHISTLVYELDLFATFHAIAATHNQDVALKMEETRLEMSKVFAGYRDMIGTYGIDRITQLQDVCWFLEGISQFMYNFNDSTLKDERHPFFYIGISIPEFISVNGFLKPKPVAELIKFYDLNLKFFKQERTLPDLEKLKSEEKN